MRKYLKIIIFLFFALIITAGLIYHAPIFSSLFKKQIFTYHTLSNNTDKDLYYYYQKAQELAQQSHHKAATFLATGDIMLSRNVALQINKAREPLLPFSQMAEILKAADFSFANLESQFAENNPIVGGHSMIFAAPKADVQGLKDYNFQVVNLANNHALDLGVTGLEFTLKYLDENQIQHIGAGNNLEEAWQPAVVAANGIKICFVSASYASANDNGKSSNNYVARIEDVQNLKSSIFNLKSTCDFIVASMHAGVEYTRTSNKSQVDFAHAAIDYGADLVIGSHPHWVQTIEKYQGSPPHPNCKKSSFDNPIQDVNGQKIQSLDLGYGCGGKYIFYSLGNFIFDQMWSQDTREGLVLKIQISKNIPSSPPLTLRGGREGIPAATLEDLQGTRIPAKLDKIELIPVVIENYSTPRPATTTESKKILNTIKQTENILK
jgi:poly-gamma-glutamate synthesis protein (capsule biosynthesis protein)